MLIDFDSSSKQDIVRRRDVIGKNYDDVKMAYFHCRREMQEGALDQTMSTVVESTALSCLARRSMIQHVDI